MALKVYLDTQLTLESGLEERLTQLDALDPGTYTQFASAVLQQYSSIDILYKHTAGGFTELKSTVDYSINGVQFTLVAPLAADEHLVVTPPSRLMLGFGGNAGANVTVTKPFYVCKDGVANYANVCIASELMTDLAPLNLSFDNAQVDLVGGYSQCSGISLVAPADVVGAAVFANGQYIGLVTAATNTTLDIASSTYTGAGVALQILGVGELQFSLAETGPFTKVLELGTIANYEATKVWVQCTATVPAVATRSPEDAIVLIGTEYFS